MRLDGLTDYLIWVGELFVPARKIEFTTDWVYFREAPRLCPIRRKPTQRNLYLINSYLKSKNI